MVTDNSNTGSFARRRMKAMLLATIRIMSTTSHYHKAKRRDRVASNLVSPTKPDPTLVTTVDNDTQSITTTSTTGSTSSSKYQPFRDHEKKKIAELLESNGGVASFGGKNQQKLSILLDCIEGLPAGERGDKLRLKYQKQVYRWQKKEDKGTYKKDILDKYGVKSFAERTAAAKEKARQCRRQIKVPVTPSKPRPNLQQSPSPHSSDSLGLTEAFEKVHIDSPTNHPRTPPPATISIDRELKTPSPLPSERKERNRSISNMSGGMIQYSNSNKAGYVARAVEPQPWKSKWNEDVPTNTSKFD
jgi:hypothetical protein